MNRYTSTPRSERRPARRLILRKPACTMFDHGEPPHIALARLRERITRAVEKWKNGAETSAI